MERPQSTLGLTVHLARIRWQQLSPRGRLVAGATMALIALAGVSGVHMATSGACCASACAAHGGCPNAHP